MTCTYSENDIALYVEGDLAPAKAGEVQMHLLTCDVCKELAADLWESQASLKSLRQDTVSTAALSAVRARVLGEIRERRSKWRWGRWVYSFAGAAFVVALVIGVASQIRRKASDPQIAKVDVPSLPAVVLETPSAPAAEKDNHTGTATPKRSKRAVRRIEVPSSAEPARPLVVKLLTDDPNVVIYWLLDKENGGTL